MSERLCDGPADARWTLLLAHGAGQGMDSDFMTDLARQLGAAGLRVVRFDFPYMQRIKAEGRRRPPDRTPVLLDAWRAVIDELVAQGVSRKGLLIGGKSMGGRMASMVAAELESEGTPVRGVVCLGYPFHPPGRPEKLRTEHLEKLKTKTLICQGTRDPFGTDAEVPGYPLSKAIRLMWLADGDHGFKPRKASGRTEAQNWGTTLDAIQAFCAKL